jgi:hypothetical protein
MISVFGYRFSDKPYLTLSESKVFSKMMNDGRVTIFNTSMCQSEGCNNYIPKGVKRYCSQTCFMKEEGCDEENDEETNAEEETWSVD